jgi:hypothetical protein
MKILLLIAVTILAVGCGEKENTGEALSTIGSWVREPITEEYQKFNPKVYALFKKSGGGLILSVINYDDSRSRYSVTSKIHDHGLQLLGYGNSDSGDYIFLSKEDGKLDFFDKDGLIYGTKIVDIDWPNLDNLFIETEDKS